MEMQCTEPTLLTCHGLEKVDQHLLGDMLTQHEALDHGMVIVETCINASVLYLCFKIFRAAECVRVRRVEDCTAHSEVYPGSLEIAFQDSRNRARKTPVSGFIAVRDRYAQEQCLQAGRIWQRAHLFAAAHGP